MKIALIGGHISPALALLAVIPKDWEVIYIGRKYTFEGDKGLSLEYHVMQERGLTFIPLTTARLQRKFSYKSAVSLSKIPYGLAQAMAILVKYRPDVVVGFGGYLSLPVALAARTLRIPLIIHEQTMHAGLANKLIAKFAKYVCISWASSAKYFPAQKTVLTGNLVRPEVLEAMHQTTSGIKHKQHRPVLYISGGSGGSHSINKLVEANLRQLINHFTIIHQTGDAAEFADYDRLFLLKETLPKEVRQHYTVMKFIPPEDIGTYYQKADIVVCRSGINTVTELLLLKKPCLLIPLVTGQTHEQLTNARFLQDVGLASILTQDQATPQNFLSSLSDIYNNLSDYHLTENINVSVHTHTASTIIQLIHAAYEKKAYKKP